MVSSSMSSENVPKERITFDLTPFGGSIDIFTPFCNTGTGK